MSDLGHNMSYNPDDLLEAQADLFGRLEAMIKEVGPDKVAPRLIMMSLFGMFTLSKFLGPDVTRDLLASYWKNLPASDPAYATAEVQVKERH